MEHVRIRLSYEYTQLRTDPLTEKFGGGLAVEPKFCCVCVVVVFVLFCFVFLLCFLFVFFLACFCLFVCLFFVTIQLRISPVCKLAKFRLQLRSGVLDTIISFV